MRFLCDNCKAKYQIADERAAGRTVRMKCRKCGHLIEVTASVTETSVSAGVVAGDDSASSKHEVGGAATQSPKGRREALAAPRPGTSAAKRVGGASGAGSGPTATSAAAKGAATTSAGLAGAFSKAVVAPPAEGPSAMSTAVAVLASSNIDEWYVGIHGVPVGPVRLSDLRRKAQQGLIDEDSLVWREGFEEWVPLRTFPELTALLREAAASTRPSFTPPPPSHPPAAVVPRPPSTVGKAASAVPTRTPVGAPAKPAVPDSSSGRSNVVAIASRRGPDRMSPVAIATADEPAINIDLSFDTGALAPLSAPPVAEEKKEELPAPEPDPAPANVVSGIALAAPAPATAEAVPTTAVSPSLADVAAQLAAPHREPGRVSRFASSPSSIVKVLVPVLLAGVLGGMGIMLLLDKKPSGLAASSPSASFPASPSAPPQASAVASAKEKAEAPDDTTTTIGPIELSGAAHPKSQPAGRSGKADNGSSGAAGAGVPPGFASLLSGGAAGPAGGTQPASAAGGQLTEADISRVVQSRRAFVSRRCWEPVMNARPAGASNAKVNVSLAIASDGHVTEANASGGDGFPGLASCIQGLVRTWTFPRNDGQSVIKIPFVFAGQ